MFGGPGLLILAFVAMASGALTQNKGTLGVSSSTSSDSSQECDVGYTYTSGKCTDINECLTQSLTSSLCNTNADCFNTQGSFRCSCKPGYVGNGVNCTSSKCVYNGVTIQENEVKVFDCLRCRCYKDRRLCTKILNCKSNSTSTLRTPASTTTAATIAASTPTTAATQGQYIYIWYSDHDGKDPDFIATVDFNRDSTTYGKVLSTAPLPESIGHNNEAHHCGLSGDNKTLIMGGFFAYVSGHPDFFLFDIGENPRQPVYKGSLEAPESSATDDFVKLPNGNVLVSMMGGVNGGTKGRIVEIDTNNEIIGEWPLDPPETLTPHGISARADANIMITSDYLLPSSLFDGPIVSRRSMRVWDLEKREIVRTISIPDSESMMDITLIPKDPQERGYAPAQGGKLYLLNTKEGTYDVAFDFNPILARNGLQNSTEKPVTQPHILRMRSDGKRGFMTMYEASKVAMLDTSNPAAPTLLRVIDLGPGAGPHYLTLTPDEKRLIVTDCFLLNNYLGGPLNFDGDRLTHVFLLSDDDFYYDPLWYHNGNYFTTGPARPHGVVVVGS